MEVHAAAQAGMRKAGGGRVTVPLSCSADFCASRQLAASGQHSFSLAHRYRMRVWLPASMLWLGQAVTSNRNYQ